MINYHNFSSKNQVSRRRHGILIKTLFLFLIACSTCITALLWGQSAAFSRPPACPTGNAANFPSPPLSQNHESVPSLWLAQKEFGGKLLDRWFVDRGNTSVIIIVNRQLWSLLDYIERYQFVNRFGTASSEYGYNLRVCTTQGTAVAVYSCKGDRLSCKIDLESLSNPGLRGKINGF
ncbi:MAG: hypothetical protein ABI180_04330 [Microcoleus sp.]